MARLFSNGFNTPLHVTLQPSFLLSMLTIIFALCCAGAIAYVVMPRSDIGTGICAACAMGWIVLHAARRSADKYPVAIEASPKGITTWHATGESMRDAQVCRVFRWGGALLSITLQSSTRRTWHLWIPADALPYGALRGLTVRLKTLAIRGGSR